MATAEQTVSAVLEATNKAYIVETGDSEDGLSHYRRQSDGTIEQWGTILKAPESIVTITFPIEFSSTDFSFVPTVFEIGAAEATSSVLGVKEVYVRRTNTSVQVACSYSATNNGYLSSPCIEWMTKGKQEEICLK